MKMRLNQFLLKVRLVAWFPLCLTNQDRLSVWLLWTTAIVWWKLSFSCDSSCEDQGFSVALQWNRLFASFDRVASYVMSCRTMEYIFAEESAELDEAEVRPLDAAQVRSFLFFYTLKTNWAVCSILFTLHSKNKKYTSPLFVTSWSTRKGPWKYFCSKSLWSNQLRFWYDF